MWFCCLSWLTTKRMRGTGTCGYKGMKFKLVLHKVEWFDSLVIFHHSVHCTVCMILCADFLFFVFRVTFPLSLLKTWSVVHTFHTRQNNGCKKRARDKLYFSIPVQLKANFRLLINRNFPVKLFSDSSLSPPQVTMSTCPCKCTGRLR